MPGSRRRTSAAEAGSNKSTGSSRELRLGQVPAIAGAITTKGRPMPTGIYERPPIVADRLRWLEPHVDGFRPWLERRGYRAVTIIEIVRLLSIWAKWADAARFDLTSIEAGLAASAVVFRGGRTARAPHGAAKLFIAWLRMEGVLPPETRRSSPEETWPLLAAYSGWMREQRGLAESTLVLHQPIIVQLLEALGDDPVAYTAGVLRDFVLERASPHGRGRAQAIASTTRSFLRYLVATGQCPLGLDHAVPGFANWQLAAAPRFLSGPDLARVLDARDGDERLRDRAIVLLLARLGLRASEAAHPASRRSTGRRARPSPSAERWGARSDCRCRRTSGTRATAGGVGAPVPDRHHARRSAEPRGDQVPRATGAGPRWRGQSAPRRPGMSATSAAARCRPLSSITPRTDRKRAARSQARHRTRP